MSKMPMRDDGMWNVAPHTDRNDIYNFQGNLGSLVLQQGNIISTSETLNIQGRDVITVFFWGRAALEALVLGPLKMRSSVHATER